MVLLDIQSLRFGYEHSLTEPFTGQLKSSEVWGILGANGSGKSTLARTLLGLHSPLSGRVQPTKGLKVGYLGQHHAINDRMPMLALDVIASGVQSGLQGLSIFTGNQFRQRALELLTRLEMVHLAKQPFRELSGGQRQLVLLLRALVDDPHLMVMDEPSTHLDGQTLTAVRMILQRILDESKMSCLVITHDPQLIQPIVTHWLSLEAKKIKFQSVHKIKEN